MRLVCGPHGTVTATAIQSEAVEFGLHRCWVLQSSFSHRKHLMMCHLSLSFCNQNACGALFAWIMTIGISVVF